jgi:hypothetical protein
MYESVGKLILKTAAVWRPVSAGRDTINYILLFAPLTNLR